MLNTLPLASLDPNPALLWQSTTIAHISSYIYKSVSMKVFLGDLVSMSVFDAGIEIKSNDVTNDEPIIYSLGFPSANSSFFLIPFTIAMAL